jgi:hypothetical protein
MRDAALPFRKIFVQVCRRLAYRVIPIDKWTQHGITTMFVALPGTDKSVLANVLESKWKLSRNGRTDLFVVTSADLCRPTTN